MTTPVPRGGKAVRTYTYPDGTVELTASSAVAGPDQVGGQHFGMNRNFSRLNGGEWLPFAYCVRNMHNALTLAGAAESAVEAFEAITGEAPVPRGGKPEDDRC